MVNYKNGKIYKLWSPEGDMIYIGSTCLSLARRKAGHKEVPRTSSKILFDTYTDIRIELIEEYPCDNKEQLNRKEGEHIRMLDCVNKYVAGRTRKEWCEDNKEHLTEKKKEWWEENKERMAQKAKEYREENKEHITEKKKEYYQENKEHHAEKNKQYYEDNKKHIAEQQKEYYQKNREHLQEKQKEYREKNKEHIAQQKLEYQRVYRERKRLEKVSIST